MKTLFWVIMVLLGLALVILVSVGVLFKHSPKLTGDGVSPAPTASASLEPTRDPFQDGK